MAITVGAFAYLLHRIELAKIAGAARAMPWYAFATVVAMTLASFLLATLRWAVLLRACGAARVPPARELTRLAWIGLFYNQYAPGAVGGDIVKGIATADCFAESGATRAIAVSVLDRIAGLSGLLLLAACAVALHPLPGLRDFRVWSVLCLALSVGALLGVVLARKAVRYLPQSLARIAECLPEMRSASSLLLAVLLSLGTQSTAVLAAHAVIAPMAPAIELADSFVIIPAVTAASYFPFTIAGAGATETALVTLYAVLGVDEAHILAAALAWLAARLLVAGVGGVINVLHPLRAPDPSETDSRLHARVGGSL